MRYTRRVPATVSVIFTGFVAAACAGGPAPVYTLQPSEAPLRYAIETEGSQTVETPNGPAGGGYDTDAVLLLAFGGEISGGRSFSAIFESFESTLESQMGQQKVDGTPATNQGAHPSTLASMNCGNSTPERARISPTIASIGIRDTPRVELRR